jgi:hypothetical protein
MAWYRDSFTFFTLIMVSSELKHQAKSTICLLDGWWWEPVLKYRVSGKPYYTDIHQPSLSVSTANWMNHTQRIWSVDPDPRRYQRSRTSGGGYGLQ